MSNRGTVKQGWLYGPNRTRDAIFIALLVVVGGGLAIANEMGAFEKRIEPTGEADVERLEALEAKRRGYTPAKPYVAPPGLGFGSDVGGENVDRGGPGKKCGDSYIASWKTCHKD